MNDLFDHFWDSSLGMTNHKSSINIDINEDENGYVIDADLPGVYEKDITVTAGHNYLTISATRERHQKDSKRHTQESYYGQMHRSITLPDHVDTDNIEANYRHGVLHLQLPKSAAHKPKRIKVTS